MSEFGSRLFIIWSIIRKDFFELARDKLWIYLSVVGLIIYAALYWMLPGTVDETISIGIHQQGMDELLQQATEEEGLKLIEFDSADELKAAVAGELETDEEINIGIVISPDFLEKMMRGEKTTVHIYTDAAAPEELRTAMASFIREMAFGISAVARGEGPEMALPVTMPEEETIILGEDRVGDQIPFRERIRPLFAFFILMVESMALASLIATEVQSRTVTAVLTTPARTEDVLVAKTVFGAVLAFSQAVIILLAIRAFGDNTLVLLTALLLGAIMVTGIAMISGAAGKDFMGTLFYSMAFMIPLTIPAFAVMFPGTASTWVSALPTYGLVQTITRVTSYAEGWSDVLPYLGMMAVWNIIIFGAGFVVLKRRIEAL